MDKVLVILILLLATPCFADLKTHCDLCDVVILKNNKTTYEEEQGIMYELRVYGKMKKMRDYVEFCSKRCLITFVEDLNENLYIYSINLD